jgi:hypothetical protein
LYDLSNDIQELDDVAAQHPAIIETMKRYAREAHAPVRVGETLDASLGFQGHHAD